MYPNWTRRFTVGETAHHLAAALATRRPRVLPKRSKMTTRSSTTDRHALQHDTKIANRLLLQLSDLAATRLLHILTHRQAEIAKLKPGEAETPPFLPRRRGIEPPPDLIP